MAETTMNSQAEPGLVRDTHEPKGVLRKNLKPLIYLGTALLVIVAAVFSGTSKKTPSQQAAARHEPPQPTVQDNTDNNVQDLKNQFAAVRQKEVQQAGLTNATAVQQADVAANTRGAGCDATIFPNNKVGLGPQIGDEIQKSSARELAQNQPIGQDSDLGQWLQRVQFQQGVVLFHPPHACFSLYVRL